MMFFFINCFKLINDYEDNAENYDNKLEDGDGLLIWVHIEASWDGPTKSAQAGCVQVGCHYHLQSTFWPGHSWLNRGISLFKKNSIDFPFKSGPCFSFTWPKKVHHLSSDGSTDVNNRPRVLVTLALALAEAIPESGVYCAGSITSSGLQRSPSQAATSQVWAFTPNKMCLFHGNCAHCTFLLNEKTGHWYHPCVATMSSGSPAGINIPSKAWSSDIFDTFVLLIYIQMIIKARSDHQRNYDPHLTQLIWWKVTWLGFLTTPSLEPRNT